MANISGLAMLGVAFVLFFLLKRSIRIVPEYQRLVFFRLGACKGQVGPGLVFILPVIDRVFFVDLREIFLEIPSQTWITRSRNAWGRL